MRAPIFTFQHIFFALGKTAVATVVDEMIWAEIKSTLIFALKFKTHFRKNFQKMKFKL